MDEAGARRCGDPAEHTSALLAKWERCHLNPTRPPSAGRPGLIPRLVAAAPLHPRCGPQLLIGRAAPLPSASPIGGAAPLDTPSPAGRAGPEQGVPPPSESPHGRGGRRRHIPSPRPRPDPGGLAVSRGKELRPFLVISESRRPGQSRPVVRVTARQGHGGPQLGTD